MSGGGNSRWRFAVLPIIILAMLVPQLLRDHTLIAELWPSWRGMILQVLLLIAASALVAALIAGVLAWRRTKREIA